MSWFEYPQQQLKGLESESSFGQWVLQGSMLRSGEARLGEGKASEESLWSDNSGQLGPSSAEDPLRRDEEYSSELTHLGSWILELYPLELLCLECTGQ